MEQNVKLRIVLGISNVIYTLL